MSKREINYLGLVSEVLKQARKDAETSGKGFDQKSAMKSAAERWKKVKEGSDSEYIQGKGKPETKKTKKTKKSKPLPGHKGAPSKTRKGRKDFITHKGDKYYHREGHLETTNEEGVAGKPYSHWTRHPKTAEDVLTMVDLCDECKKKIEDAIGPKRMKKLKKQQKKINN